MRYKVFGLSPKKILYLYPVNPHLCISEGYYTVCVCVCVFVCPPVFSVAARALSVKRGHVGK